MRRIIRRDAAAFDILMDRYSSRLRARIQRIVRNHAAADDILQEVFLRVWTRSNQWNAKGSPAGWLTRTAVNLALNYLRTQRRRKCRSLELPVHDDTESESRLPSWMVDPDTLQPDEVLEKTERIQQLHCLVQALPPQQRQVIQMVHEAEMDMQDVAEQLQIPIGTVKSRLFYARSRLSRAMSDD